MRPCPFHSLRTASLFPSHSSSTHPLSLRSRACVRRTPGAPIRLFIFLLAGSAMGTIDNFLFVDIADLGGSTLIDGLALTVTCLSEVVIFWYAGEIHALLGTDGSIHVTLACYTLRLLYYALLHWIGQPWAVLPVQLLHGITFGCAAGHARASSARPARHADPRSPSTEAPAPAAMGVVAAPCRLYWSTGCNYARSLAPPALQTTLQGMFQGINSLGGFLGNLIGGYVYMRFGSVTLWVRCEIC